jgi:transcription elongation GreA/GreB family factor
MDPTFTLSKDEKKFLSCFYTGQVELLKPEYKEWISLYAYLDNRNAPIESQYQFTRNQDIIISVSLRIIGNNVDNDNKLLREVGKLKSSNLHTNENFFERFKTAAKWFWYLESDTYINQANKKIQTILARIEKNHYQIYIEDAKICKSNSDDLVRSKSNIKFNTRKKENSSKHHKNKISKHDQITDISKQSVEQAIKSQRSLITLDAFELLKKIANDLKRQKEALLKNHKNNIRSYSDKIAQLDLEISTIINSFPFYEVIDPSINYGSNCIRFGAILTLKKSLKLRKIKIVGSVELKFEYDLKKELLEDWDLQYVNWSSPLGANLISKQVGDSTHIGLTGNLHSIIEVIYPKPLR